MTMWPKKWGKSSTFASSQFEYNMGRQRQWGRDITTLGRLLPNSEVASTIHLCFCLSVWLCHLTYPLWTEMFTYPYPWLYILIFQITLNFTFWLNISILCSSNISCLFRLLTCSASLLRLTAGCKGLSHIS